MKILKINTGRLKFIHSQEGDTSGPGTRQVCQKSMKQAEDGVLWTLHSTAPPLFSFGDLSTTGRPRTVAITGARYEQH